MKHKKHVEIHEKARVPVFKRVLETLLPARQVHIEEDMDESDEDDVDNDGGVGWRGVMGLTGMVGLAGLFAWYSRYSRSNLQVAVEEAGVVGADDIPLHRPPSPTPVAADVVVDHSPVHVPDDKPPVGAASEGAGVDVIVAAAAAPPVGGGAAAGAGEENPFFVDMYLKKLRIAFPNLKYGDNDPTADSTITSGYIDDMVRQLCAGNYKHSHAMQNRMNIIEVMLSKIKNISEMCKTEKPTIGAIIETISQMDMDLINIPDSIAVMDIQKGIKVKKPNQTKIEKDYIFVSALVFYIDVLITSLTGTENKKRTYFLNRYKK